MTIWYDPRVGSGALGTLKKASGETPAVMEKGPLIPDLLKGMGIEVQSQSQMYGDFSFLGRGEGEVPVPVGIERKKLQDLINSSYEGRLTEQLKGLLLCYQDIWVVVEGVNRRGPEGLLEVPGWKKGEWVPLEYGKKTFMYSELEAAIITLEEKGGVRVKETRDKYGTAHFLKTLHHWWTDKTYDQHRSHLRFRSSAADQSLLVSPSLCREWASRLPGVAWTKSGKVADYFKSGYAMAMAEEGAWKEVEGIGGTMAKRIVEAIRKEKG